MKLKAERVNPDISKTLLYNAQCRHFLRHKQNAFSVIKRIRYHIGDSLRFTRSGRAV